MVDKEGIHPGFPHDSLRVATVSQILGNGEDPLVVALVDPAQQLAIRHVSHVLLLQVVGLCLQGPDGFQEGLLKAAANGHDFACGFHLGAQLPVRAGELVEGEPGELRHNVVQRRFEAGVARAGDRVQDLVQCQADGQFCGNLRNGIARGLGRQGRGPGHTGIDFNDVILEAVGIQRQLHVAAAADLQRPDDFQARCPQHLVFLVCQGLHRGHDNGVTCVDAHRVHVFHVADHDCVVVGIPHDFVLDFLVPRNGALDQTLVHRGDFQPGFRDPPQFFLIVRKTATGAAQRVGRTHHHRIAQVCTEVHRFLHRVHDHALGHRLADFLHQVPEQLPVLRPVDGLQIRPQDLDPVILQNAVLCQFHHQVQACLSAQGAQDGIRALLADDTLGKFQ